MSNTNDNSHSQTDIIISRITGAASLIVLGLFFLLNSTGVIPWSAWGTVFLIFLRIWPVFIIIAGLQVIFGKHSIVSSLFNIVSTLIFILTLLLATYANTNNSTLKQDLERNIPFFQSFNLSIDQGEYLTKDLEVTKQDFDTADVSERPGCRFRYW